MSNKKTFKIIAVSYLNTLPFIYGIKESKQLESYNLILDHPSKCVENAIKNNADIALIPVDALSLFKNCEIISDFCLGTLDKVSSVMLFSNKPISDITEIALDSQSVTSVKLTKILAKHYWKNNNIKWSVFDDESSYENIGSDKAILLIGDKVLENTNCFNSLFNFQYDLAQEWNKFTKLPFVFAVWIKLNPDLSEVQLNLFNNALKFGVKYRLKAIEEVNGKYPINTEKYITESISYDFDKEKQKALEKFTKLSSEL